MNLNTKNFMTILVGGMAGAIAAFIYSYFYYQKKSPGVDSLLEQGIYATIAFIVVAFLIVFILIIMSAYNPKAESARNFSSINGVGSLFVGKSDVKSDGSYITTEWLSVLWIPLLPICRYRLIKHEGSNYFKSTYTIISKYPPKMKHIIKIYAIIFLVGYLIITLLDIFYFT